LSPSWRKERTTAFFWRVQIYTQIVTYRMPFIIKLSHSANDNFWAKHLCGTRINPWFSVHGVFLSAYLLKIALLQLHNTMLLFFGYSLLYVKTYGRLWLHRMKNLRKQHKWGKNWCSLHTFSSDNGTSFTQSNIHR
jgi:hypothetical protein